VHVLYTKNIGETTVPTSTPAQRDGWLWEHVRANALAWTWVGLAAQERWTTGEPVDVVCKWRLLTDPDPKISECRAVSSYPKKNARPRLGHGPKPTQISNPFATLDEKRCQLPTRAPCISHLGVRCRFNWYGQMTYQRRRFCGDRRPAVRPPTRLSPTVTRTNHVAPPVWPSPRPRPKLTEPAAPASASPSRTRIGTAGWRGRHGSEERTRGLSLATWPVFPV
jgi:hypothetical protein